MDNRTVMRINAEKRVYNAHAAAIRAIIPVIEGMDGKILDKRLKTAMDAAEDGYYFNYSVRLIGRQNEFSITGYNGRDRMYFASEPDKNGCRIASYVTNDTFSCTWGDAHEVLTYTDTGKFRINAAPMIKKLEERAAYYENKAANMDMAINDGEKIRDELQEICSSFAAFNHKYPYEVLEILGLKYCMNYNGSSATRDYSIRY